MLVERLRERAAAEPDAAAFIVAGGGSLTYRTWNRRSEALSQGLLERGVRPDDRVVLSFEARNWCDFAVAYAGVHQAGAIPVLVSLGPQHSQGALGRIIAHCGASIVVGSAKLVPPTGLAGTLAWFGSVGELEDGHDGRQRSGPSSPGKPVELSYRSGPLRSLQVTRHGHGDILSDLVMVDAASPGLGGTPFLHAFPCGSEGARRALWIPLGPSPGAVVTLVSFAPDAFCALAAEHGAARWSLGPSAAGFILDSGVLDSGVLDGHDLSSLVHLVLLTGKASPALLARLGAALPRASVLSLARTVSAPGDAGERRRGESGQNRRVHAPVAFSQEGMLWHEQFVPGSQNLPPLVRRYHGPLDVEVLERALIEIVRRHEPLRTTFEMQAGRLVQIVSPVDLRLVRHDLGSSAHAQEAVVAMLLGDLRRPFDLVEGPLFEAHLVRLGPRDHLVAFRVHHSVYDDWSVSVFRRELSALYAAFLAGRPSPLEDLPLSFGDLSRAQHRRMEGPAGAVELSWWKDELAGAPLCLQLPIDDPDRPQGAPQASAEPVSLELPPELATQLRALARRERTTLFMTMTAAFQALLQRWTGQEELLLATVVANRNRRELEQMVGCFTKKVLVRLSGVGDPTFVELLPRVRTALLGALAHQDLPFETVLQRSLSSAAAVHGLVPHPVVMLQGVTPQTDDLVLPGLTTSGYQTSATTTRTHFSAGDDDRSDTGAAPWGAGLYLGTFLILSVIEEGAGVSLSARGAFHGPSVKRLLATFETLLADIVAHPERRMSELRLLDDRLLDDRHQAELVGRGDDIDAQVPGDRAHEIFQAQASRTPSRLAVHDGGQSLTYEQLASRAQVLADRLRRLGVGRGDLVGLCMATSTDAVVAVLAIWKAGAGYVALDAEDTDARHRQIIVRASLGVVVTQGRLGPSELEGLATVVVDDDGPSRAPLVTDAEAGVDADVALVFYGSGPSAVPHGVVIEHGGVVNLLAGLRGHVLRPSSEPTPLVGLRVCLSARPTDDAFLRQLVPVLDGHTLQVVPGDAGGGVAALVALIGSGDVDLVDCPPGELEDLVGVGLSAALAARPTGAATPVVVAGSRAPIRCDTLSVLGSMNMARTYLLYGPPECSFGAAVSPVSTGAGRISLGPPLGAGMGVVLDAQGRLVPEGVTGELHLAGPGLSTGYLGEAEATARRFVTLKLAGPGGASTRLFKTGQRARYLPGARIELVGRVADMVDLRGFHVDRARMAAALRQCRGVAGVEVVLDQDGAGEPHLVALVVPEKGSPAPTLVELRTELWSRLPGYAWPASVIVVPRLSARGGQPWPAGAPSQPGYPESPQARLLASLWAEVRGVEHVGVSENYWQSFSFLDAMALAGEQGVPIGSQEVTRNRVLATLATALAAAGGA